MSALTLSFAVYLTLVVVIGVLTARRTGSQRDFLLGGQRLPPWALAISERASGESAWLLLGLTGAAVSVGLSEIWTVFGCVGGIFILWFFLGRRLRTVLGSGDALTVPELLAQRFDSHARSIRWLGSLIIIFFFTFYVAAQIVGASKVFLQTGIINDAWPRWGASPERFGIVLGATVVVAYTLAGGFSAVVWTDLLQGLIMVLALLILPAAGLAQVLTQSSDLTAALAAAGAPKAAWFGGKTGFDAAILMLNGLSWGLGYLGQPQLLVRFMAMPRAEDVSAMRGLAAGWTVIAYGGAFAVGLFGLALFGAGHFADAEGVMPTMAKTLLPAWLAGIVVAGAVAAMMSTADSQLLVATSAVSEDLCSRIFGLRLSTRQQVLLSRSVVLVIGVAALALALASTKLVYDTVSFAWSGLGAAFGPAVLLTAIWRRFNGAGVLASLFVGSTTTIVWKRVPRLAVLASERLVAWLMAFVAAVLTSLPQPVSNPKGHHSRG